MTFYKIDNIWIDKNNLIREMKTGLFNPDSSDPLANGIYRECSILYFFKDGLAHREDGPAIEHLTSDFCEWWFNGLRHRLDGPAIEYSNGDKEWYQHGKHHRLDGPAVEYADGDKWWYLDGKRIDCNSQQQFEKLLKLKAFW